MSEQSVLVKDQKKNLLPGAQSSETRKGVVFLQACSCKALFVLLLLFGCILCCNFHSAASEDFIAKYHVRGGIHSK